jgi:hypothetical protein
MQSNWNFTKEKQIILIQNEVDLPQNKLDLV